MECRRVGKPTALEPLGGVKVNVLPWNCGCGSHFVAVTENCGGVDDFAGRDHEFAGKRCTPSWLQICQSAFDVRWTTSPDGYTPLSGLGQLKQVTVTARDFVPGERVEADYAGDPIGWIDLRTAVPLPAPAVQRPRADQRGHRSSPVTVWCQRLPDSGNRPRALARRRDGGRTLPTPSGGSCPR